jgi:hypothetical protein
LALIRPQPSALWIYLPERSISLKTTLDGSKEQLLDALQDRLGPGAAERFEQFVTEMRQARGSLIEYQPLSNSDGE